MLDLLIQKSTLGEGGMGGKWRLGKGGVERNDAIFHVTCRHHCLQSEGPPIPARVDSGAADGQLCRFGLIWSVQGRFLSSVE